MNMSPSKLSRRQYPKREDGHVEGVPSGLMATICLHWATSGVFCRLCLRPDRGELPDCFRALLVVRKKMSLKFDFEKSGLLIIIVDIMDHILCSWHCMFIIAFDSHNNPLTWMVIIVLFYS